MKRGVQIAAAVGTLATLAMCWPRGPTPDLVGLWARPQSELGERGLRFYYFHTDGHGLYRYGRDTLTQTVSFDYAVKGETLALHFRKSGQDHAVRFRIEPDGALVLIDDPREGRDTRYVRTRGPIQQDHPFARMWTNVERHQTGGYTFRIYQLQAPNDAGHGPGWFHTGDFDDWTTESLSYDRIKDRLTLSFDEQKDRHTTALKLGHNDGLKTITLEADPRDFWHRRTYVDGGRSFAEGVGLTDVIDAVNLGNAAD